MGATRMKVPPAFFFGAAWLGLDLGTKQWAHRALQFHDIELVPHFFRLSLVRNSGIAFGLFDNAGAGGGIKSVVLVCVALAALLIVGTHAARTPARARWAQLALGLLLGGITGNMIDRIRHYSVVDFLDFDLYFFKFPTFNVADCGITIGVALLILMTLRHPGTLPQTGAVPESADTLAVGPETEC